jgi:molybdopterin-containing oxidoreductase family iron-sulfur binding subunit
MRQVPFKVSFSSADDETTALADLVLPDHTPFEAWGDAEPIRGVRRLQQPTVRPLFDTRALGDVLLDVARRLGAGDRLPTGSFRDALLAAWGGRTGFESALAKGGDFRPAETRPVALTADPSQLTTLKFAPAEIVGDGKLTLVAYPSLHLYDGRSARIPMLQEIPDPVTKTVWGSCAELHPETAAELGVTVGDVLRVATGSGEIEVPAFPHEGVRRGVLAIAVGQGHRPVEPELDVRERWGQTDWLQRTITQGVNVLALLPGRLDPASGALAWLSAKVDVAKTGERRFVPGTQPTFDQERRGFSQSASRAALAGGAGAHAEAPHLETKEYDAAADSGIENPYRWGMSIDLDACTGCNACIAACNRENSIPNVGPEMVARGREMHWIRIERYVERHGDTLDVRHSPMLCQHCGAAPCENVCPVLATYHTDDGLNMMVYNRCIGTRYCSNNCPYKVRRFNYLPYDFEVREPENLMLHPDVTVRTKGVMEKCTFCVQRIGVARDAAKAANRNILDGEITPACAQTCPSRAIVFGNLKDPASRVSGLRVEARAYRALEHLYTRPAVSYLRSIRRDDHDEPEEQGA